MPTYLSPGVYVEEIDAGARPIEGVPTAVAAFVGFADRGPFNTPTLVSNWTQFTTTFGDFVEGSYLAHAVYGYFSNGGGNCYIVRIGDGGASGGSHARPEEAPQAILGRYRVTAKPEALTDGRNRAGANGANADITVEITPNQPGSEGGDDSFTLVVKRGDKIEESFPGVTTKRGKDNVVTVVREKSKMIVIEDAGTAGAALAKPESGAVVLAAPTPPPALPAQVAADDYLGDVSERTGFGGLEAVDEVTMVCVPDLMSAYQRGMIDLETLQAVQLGMITHCELMGDRIAIIDPPPSLNPQQVKEWRMETAGYDSKYAAMYYPWIKVFDPSTGSNVMVPPSGHMAGVWARNDALRGVHKAPANEVVRGAVALETQVTKNEQELLNPNGINCIRAFPGRGIRVWGARTLSSDPAWRYLNVRRLFNFLEESILNGTQWAVFEPNDDALWGKIRRAINAFLVMQWRAGALFGLTPAEAYFVKCDRDTNPAEAIDAGQVVCEIGVAPVKPAEFVVFRLSQFSGGTSLVSE